MAKFKEQLKGLLKNKAFLVGAASFVLPALALYIIFIINGVHPFGDKQILVTDLWHQYYPFLCELQQRLKEGQSILYSENIGLGINFWALIAYYCASPLNILITLVSKEALRDLLAVMVALKVGFSGLFFSLYLKKVFSRYDKSTVAFSMVYALCGYVLGYYWNIMWHDCVALLPLVMLGVYSLIKENKWILYVVSLAIAVISNFYIGFMVCIFTAIYFFFECAKSSMGLKAFAKKLLMMALCSILALALTAFMTIPAYLALQDTVSSVPKNSANTEKSLIIDLGDAIEDIKEDAANNIGRMASFNEPVPKEGLPNLFSGFISVILLGFFFMSKKIKLSEKLSTALMLLVLLLSVTISDLDIIWHGFHKPNMVPYRYAFVFSFAMVITAYRAYVAEFTGEDRPKRKTAAYILPILFAAAVIVCAFAKAEIATILGCSALAIVYFVIMATIDQHRNTSAQSIWNEALCGVIIIEMLINTAIAVPTVRTTTYSTYYYRGEEVERLLEDVDADESLLRVETSQEYILNDPALYGYKGVSTFTSTANYPVTKLMEKLALCAPARANRYYYETTSPLVNSFLGVEHIIFKNDMKNLNPYLESVAEEWTADEKYKNVIYKNTEVLPLGFMTDKALVSSALLGENPFDVQNDLFRKATGLEGDLFTRVSLKSIAGESTIKVTGAHEGKYTFTEDPDKKPVLHMNYVAPDENSLYAYVECKQIKKIIVSNTTYKVGKRAYIFPAGSYHEGEKFKFKFEFEDTFKDKASVKFHVYSMNEKLFEEGMERLRDESFEIEEYKSRKIKGRINALEDGYFYTSIPYEKGWRLFVDGKETEIKPFEGAMIGVELAKGEHSIVLRYTPFGFGAGVLISIAALIMLIVAIIITGRRQKNGQDINSGALL
ncbi:MAG: YfhO family protein [Clostridia bacterium]|nr:YfhO family protein [Clostridia bacterium]